MTVMARGTLGQLVITQMKKSCIIRLSICYSYCDTQARRNISIKSGLEYTSIHFNLYFEGFNVETIHSKNVNLTVWDVGMRSKSVSKQQKTRKLFIDFVFKNFFIVSQSNRYKKILDIKGKLMYPLKGRGDVLVSEARHTHTKLCQHMAHLAFDTNS